MCASGLEWTRDDWAARRAPTAEDTPRPAWRWEHRRMRPEADRILRRAPIGAQDGWRSRAVGLATSPDRGVGGRWRCARPTGATLDVTSRSTFGAVTSVERGQSCVDTGAIEPCRISGESISKQYRIHVAPRPNQC